MTPNKVAPAKGSAVVRCARGAFWGVVISIIFFGFVSPEILPVALILVPPVLIAWCVSALLSLSPQGKLRGLLKIQFSWNWRVAIFCFFVGTLWSAPISLFIQVLTALALQDPWDFGNHHPRA